MVMCYVAPVLSCIVIRCSTSVVVYCYVVVVVVAVVLWCAATRGKSKDPAAPPLSVEHTGTLEHWNTGTLEH